MKILVLSDTHIPVAAKQLPLQVLREAENVQMCLHAGDLIEYNVVEQLSQITKTYAVSGNMDNDETRQKVPLRQLIRAGKTVIGLTHGAGAPQQIIKTVQEEFLAEAADINIFVFGHSHLPCDEIIGNKIYFNPGSPTDKVFAPYRSYGIIHLAEDGRIERKVIRIE